MLWPCICLILLVAATGAQAQPVPTNECDALGDIPDVTVGEFTDIIRFTSQNNITAYALGTYSCNPGTCWLDWFQESVRHPVIAQNMYRLKDGKFEQIGQAWLKHGFLALSDNVCHTDCFGTTGTHLGVHCSDPYVASLNGQQSNMGPKHEVNPSNGSFVFPFSTRGVSGNSIYKRLQVSNNDLEPDLNPGAQYFFEGTYLFPDDAPVADAFPDSNMDGKDDFDQVDNSANNSSYIRINITEGTPGIYSASFAAPVVREKTAVFAWRGAEGPTVSVKEVLVPLDPPVPNQNEGRFWVASKATSLGGGLWHYEYAIENQTSNRAAKGFSVPIPFGANVTNIGFHDVNYHSELTNGTGSFYDPADWLNNGAAGFSVAWNSPPPVPPYDTGNRDNALRWGTMYNFRFDADVAPATGTATIELFLPGNPASVQVAVAAPTACNTNGTCDPGETNTNCVADCVNQGGGGGFCGDATCNAGESSCTCLRDCGVPPTVEFVCNDGDDLDCDGQTDCADSDCCSAVSCAGPDADMDGFELCDCNDANGAVWSQPGEAEDLQLSHNRATGTTTLEWTSPVQPGAAAITYEVLRSSNPTNFLSSTTCVADIDPSDTTIDDTAPAVPDDPFNYLVRAVNACPGSAGDGVLSRGSNNVPVRGRACP